MSSSSFWLKIQGLSSLSALTQNSQAPLTIKTKTLLVVQVDCSTLSFVRDKVPVFCEKRTEVYNGEYVTTRGCSVDYRWEDVQGYRDIAGGQVPCIRRKGKETCLCSNDRCNSGTREGITLMAGVVGAVITAMVR